jgi:hypothetical protein
MPSASGYTNTGRSRVRRDGSDPDEESSRLEIQEPEGASFNISDDEDQAVYLRDPATGEFTDQSTVARFAIFANITDEDDGFVKFFISDSGDSVDAEAELETILGI